MGLDTTHGCWHGAYSAFGRCRVGLAKEIGINLNLMEGFSGRGLNGIAFDPMKWSALKPDPLHILLNHSDCEGSIAPEDCAPLAARLREVAAGIEPGRDAGGHLDGIREAAITFAEGLERAAAANEPVEFH